MAIEQIFEILEMNLIYFKFIISYVFFNFLTDLSIKRKVFHRQFASCTQSSHKKYYINIPRALYVGIK